MIGRSQSTADERNLLDLKPVRRVEWEARPDGIIVVLVPKFKNKWMVRWIVPRMKKPFFHVRLDQHGSFVWNLCDGSTTIGSIAAAMKKEFGEDFDPSLKRIAMFVRQMVKTDLLLLQE